MKEAHLVYNKLLNLYVFYDSRTKSDHFRTDFGRVESPSFLVKKLLGYIDVKRKMVLHLENVPDKDYMAIKNRIGSERIRIKRETTI